VPSLSLPSSSSVVEKDIPPCIGIIVVVIVHDDVRCHNVEHFHSVGVAKYSHWVMHDMIDATSSTIVARQTRLKSNL
jgi:hypothetical protein